MTAPTTARTPPAQDEDPVDRLTFGAGRAESRPAPHDVHFHRLLVGFDGSPSARLALDWARSMALLDHAAVVLATIVPPPPIERYELGYGWWQATTPGGGEQARTKAEASLDGAAAPLEEAGIPVERVVATGGATRELVGVATSRHVDLAVLGSHSRGPVGRVLMGSTADSVRHRLDASVLVARNAPTPQEILVPVDGSASSRRAAAIALRLALAWGAHATLLHVIEPPVARPELPPLEEMTAEMRLDDAPHVAHRLGIGHPTDEILRVARELDAGLVVMGTRGLGALRSRVMGSVSNRVARDAAATVLLVHAEPPDLFRAEPSGE